MIAATARLGLIAVLAASVAVAAASAPEPETSRVLDGLQRWLDDTETLTADFEQTLVTELLGGEVRESGRLYLRRPGYMRWDYEDPEKKSALVLDDETLLYLEDEQQLIRGRLDAEAGLLPALLTGKGRLAELFEAERVGGAGRETLLRLVPRSTAEAVESVTLRLRDRDFAIDRAEVVDPAGNRMRYDFRNLRRNRRLPPGIFVLQTPPGTEIVEQP